MSRNQFAPVPLLRTLALSTAPAQKSTPPQTGNSGSQPPAGGQNPVDTLRAPQSRFTRGGLSSLHFARILSGAVAVLLVAAACGGEGSDPLAICVQPDAPVNPIQVTFVPVLDRNPNMLPAGIGVTPSCTRPLYTKNADFVVHVQSPGNEEWTMGDFFRVWGDDNPYRGMGTNNVSVNSELYQGDYNDIRLEDGLRVIIDFMSQ